MSIVLRVDVDNAYPRDWWHFPFEVLRTKLNLGYRVKWFDYMKNLERLLDTIEERGIKANFYFRPSTLPPSEIVNRLKENGHEIGLHAVQTQNFDGFSRELKEVEDHFGIDVRGWSKHGEKRKLSRLHDKRYDSDVFLRYTEMAELDYFLGNGTDPSDGLKLDSPLFFPSRFSLKEGKQKKSLPWLFEESEKRDVVVLAHPVNVLHKKNIREKFNRIIDGASSFKTVSEVKIA